MTNKKMNRRNFVKNSLVAAGATLGSAAVATPVVASGKRRLKMVTTWPKGFPGMGTSAQHVVDRIKAATNGRIDIKVYGGGELVPPLGCFDAVSTGTADCFHSASYYWQGKNTAFSFFTTVPFGMTEPEMLAWMRWGGGQQLWDELYAKHNLKPFMAGNSGVQMGGWFRKEINSVEDLKGLKMRIPGLGGSAMQKLGVSTITLPAGELFQALQSGTVDATEWVGPWLDLIMGFYKVAPYYYYPGFHEPSSIWELSFNKETWDSFSKSDQEIISACINAEYSRSTAEFNAKNIEGLNTLVNKHNVKLRKFDDEIYEALAKATKETLNEVVSKNKDAKKIYTSYRKFYEKANQWTEISTSSYVELRSKVYDI